MKPFDKEDVYDAEIGPLVDAIIRVCRKHDIPMLASFCYACPADEDGREDYCTTSIPGECRTFEQASRVIQIGVQEGQRVTIMPPSGMLMTVTTKEGE